jgi:hypothetical protein
MHSLSSTTRTVIAKWDKIHLAYTRYSSETKASLPRSKTSGCSLLTTLPQKTASMAELCANVESRMTKNTIVVLGCLAVMALLDILIYMSQNMSQI